MLQLIGLNGLERFFAELAVRGAACLSCSVQGVLELSNQCFIELVRAGSLAPYGNGLAVMSDVLDIDDVNRPGF